MKKVALIIMVAVLLWGMGIEPGMAFWGQKKARTSEEQKPAAEPPAAAVPAESVAEPAKTEPPAPRERPAKEAVEKPAAGVQPAAEPAPRAGDAAKEKMRALQQQQRAKLNNSQWQIDSMLLSGEGKPRTDMLIFKDNQVYSEYYAQRGFGASNYTLTVQDDGAGIWETMQSSEKEGMLFWRGEINDQQTETRGVVSHQKPDGVTEDYSFISRNRQAFQEKRPAAKP